LSDENIKSVAQYFQNNLTGGTEKYSFCLEGCFNSKLLERILCASSTIMCNEWLLLLSFFFLSYNSFTKEKTISYLDKVSADSIPNLATGTCILAGLMAKIPVVIKVDEIKERKNQPQSHNIDLIKGWE
jgi:hypothetical protein